MTRNLDTADTIVKLVLAVLVLALFVSGVIAGPFAVLLAILAAVILVIFAARLLYRNIVSRRSIHRPGNGHRSGGE